MIEHVFQFVRWLSRHITFITVLRYGSVQYLGWSVFPAMIWRTSPSMIRIVPAEHRRARARPKTSPSCVYPLHYWRVTDYSSGVKMGSLLILSWSSDRVNQKVTSKSSAWHHIVQLRTASVDFFNFFVRSLPVFGETLCLTVGDVLPSLSLVISRSGFRLNQTMTVKRIFFRKNLSKGHLLPTPGKSPY